MPKVNTLIQKITFQPHHIFGKSFMLHGTTGSGKSRTMLYLSSLINDSIDIPIVYCPTNETHGDWDGIVPEVMINKQLTSDAILNIIKFTEDKGKAKKTANGHIKYWKQLPGNVEIDAEYIKKKEDLKAFVVANRATLVQDDYDKFDYDKRMLRRERNKKSRALINKMYKKLYAMNGIDRKNPIQGDPAVVELEEFVKYFRVDSYILLVIDDCSDQYSSIDADMWKLLFNKSRHYKMTVFMNTHNMGDIKTQCLRTAPFWNIFLTQNACSTFFSTPSTGLKGQIVLDPVAVAKACSRDFEKGTMTKIAYQRDPPGVYKYTFPLDFSYKIGAEILWKYDNDLRERRKKRPNRISQSIL